jgi:hypothetical protein
MADQPISDRTVANLIDLFGILDRDRILAGLFARAK